MLTARHEHEVGGGGHVVDRGRIRRVHQGRLSRGPRRGMAVRCREEHEIHAQETTAGMS